MRRRDFLKFGAVAAAALAIDPERLLWTPGRKTIFLPTARQLEYLQAGELVTFDIETTWGFHRNVDHGSWVFVRKNDVRKLTGPLNGRMIGVVERVDRADVKLQTGGWVNVLVTA